jgi:hypothetical protein
VGFPLNRVKYFLQSVGDFYQRHERISAPSVFLGGVAYDIFTVTRIDRLFENIILLAYLLVLGVAIVLFARRKQGRLSLRIVEKYEELLPLLIQFLLGGLLSVYGIFYFRSTPLSVSSIFLVLILGLLFLNEFLYDRLMNLHLLVTLYFFVWFSFAVFFVPILLDDLGTGVFVASALISLVPVGVVIYLVYGPDLRERLSSFLTQTGSVMLLFSCIFLFYGYNLIPPVPLAMESGGIYYDVEKTNDQYVMKTMRQSWLEQFSLDGNRIPWRAGQPIYCFVSVFAPVDLSATIRHQWQYFHSPETGWVTTDNLTYRIRGGRAGGYRGYTFKQNLEEGYWRVNVLTANDRLVGRLTFYLDQVPAERSLFFSEIVR